MDLFWMSIVEPLCIERKFFNGWRSKHELPDPTLHLHQSGNELDKCHESRKAHGKATVTRIRFPQESSARLDLNTSETGGTLQQFRDEFENGEIFESASEICRDIDLVPTESERSHGYVAYELARSFWAANANPGDNARERPYANLYPRLTTKSNTFTIPCACQALQKVPGTPA
jgi:hypothetical protein